MQTSSGAKATSVTSGCTDAGFNFVPLNPEFINQHWDELAVELDKIYTAAGEPWVAGAKNAVLANLFQRKMHLWLGCDNAGTVKLLLLCSPMFLGGQGRNVLYIDGFTAVTPVSDAEYRSLLATLGTWAKDNGFSHLLADVFDSAYAKKLSKYFNVVSTYKLWREV